MPGRLLITYGAESTFVTTTWEYLNAFWKYSSWDVAYAHVTDGAKLGFRLDEFDAVLNSYSVRLCFEDQSSTDYLEQLEQFRGVKLLSVQDEYDRTNIERAWIKRLGFNVVFTCVPQESIFYVYSPDSSLGAEFITVLTGYVPEDIPKPRKLLPLVQRPISIGYRGRDIGARYGRLGFEKIEIGRRMREICDEKGIAHDIEWTEEKRLYGRAWYDFLGSCRATLGTESGCNVFDFDGSLERAYNEMSIERGERVSYEDFRHLTENRENEVDMGQISPRMFEAASLGTPMILYEGRYSGVLEPWKHYIPLAKDFSNLEIVLSKISDVDYLTGLSARAYDDLIASGRFSYGKFVEEVDSVLDRVQSKIGAIERENRKTLVSDRLDLEHQEEYPTNTPRPVEYFLLRQEQRRGLAWRLYFERLISESQQASLMNVIIRPGSGLWRMGKRAWRLLPATLRYRLATMLLGSSARLDT